MEKMEEECGQVSYENAFVRTSSYTLDIAVPLPTLNPSLRSGGFLCRSAFIQKKKPDRSQQSGFSFSFTCTG